MSDLNPYAPPQSDPLLPSDSGAEPLASPWLRLGAAILDAIILGAILFPVQYLTGAFQRMIQRAEEGVNFAPETLLWTAIGFVTWVAVNWVFLQNGQTIGKKVAKVQIRRKDGSPIQAARIVTHRQLPIQIVALIPFLGGLLLVVDALLIFRKGRNTLHDDIAGTKVVKVPG